MKTKHESNHENFRDDSMEEIIIENDQFLIQFPWAENLVQWKWYYKENRVIFNKIINSSPTYGGRGLLDDVVKL